MALIGWIRARDADLLALRRAARAAIVMPALFAISIEVIGNPIVAAFAAFGSFAMLLLVSFGGPIVDRARAQLALALTGAVFVVVGTLVSRVDWLAAIVTAVVAFSVIFAGVVSSVLAGATPALLLAFILPVSLPGPVSTIPDRLAGWGMASGAALLAVTLLWPSPVRDRLRESAVAAARALAARLRARVAVVLGAPGAAARELDATASADAASVALQRAFYGTPYRPTGLTTATRVLVRLVDELGWLGPIVSQGCASPPGARSDPQVCAVQTRAAAALEAGADLLDHATGDPATLRAALDELRAALEKMEHAATVELPGSCAPAEPGDEQRFGELISALDPSFRAQELSFVVAQIGANIDAVAAAERRSWLARVLGRDPARMSSGAETIGSAQERATSHLSRGSVWLHNSLRGSAALGLAVLVADLTDVQHGFWVVLGALAVLRSNALSTGQNALRGMAGTVAGFVVGAALVTLIGTNTTLLWVLLAPAILIAGFAPAAISFAAGQGAFTVALVILYNIIQPTGWRVGLVRVEDVATGCAVSLLVGLLFWPRGAAWALGDSLARAYRESARYLSAAVAFGMARSDAGAPAREAPALDARRAAAAARRLDDTFRTYLAERGGKGLPLAEATALVTGVAGLRLAADAVLDLWRRDSGAGGDRADARAELVRSAGLVTGWYERLAASLAGVGEAPAPLGRAGMRGGGLFEALDRDLAGADRRASATAVRMIWTADHLDGARRLQGTLVGPAAKVAAHRSPVASSSPVHRWVLRMLGLAGPLEPQPAAAGHDALDAYD